MSVMKKILTFFMLLLILCACETRLTYIFRSIPVHFPAAYKA